MLRIIFVFVFTLTIVLFKKDYKEIKQIRVKSWIFLTLSGIATGGAWLCEYVALNINGVNPVAVNSIGKLSILLKMLFSFIVLKEKFTLKEILGLAILKSGIIVITIFSL